MVSEKLFTPVPYLVSLLGGSLDLPSLLIVKRVSGLIIGVIGDSR